MNRKNGFLLVSVLLFIVTIFFGCSSDKPADTSTVQAENDSNCISCHINSEYLIKQAEQKLAEKSKDESQVDEEITAESLAEGWLLSNEFLNSTHGKQSCEECHKGDPQAVDKEIAHSQKVGFVTDPTEDGGSICSTCHSDTVKNFKTSLHYTQQGIKNGLMARLGTTPHKEEAFDKIFYNDCSICHATCGQCHVSKPTIADGGLLEGHVFTTDIDSKETCAACHDTAEPEYYAHDVHAEKGLECIACHTSVKEMHGDGSAPSSERDPGVVTASCTDCHKDLDKVSNAHTTHMDNVSCFACHGQSYQNCYGCHDGEPEEYKFEVHLGKGSDGKITTFTHVPWGEDGYSELGVKLKNEDINKKAAWIQWRPHTIARTPQIKEGAENMCDNCHGNPEIFIKVEELDFPDLEKDIVVKKLPNKLK